jgi:octaprenyl-diphosphate synthase
MPSQSVNTAAVSAGRPPRPDIDQIRALIDTEMQAVDRTIHERLSSDVALINRLGAYIIHNGGKRLRPVTLLLSTGAFGYQGEAHVTLAAIIEFIHTATLLHDDVVDASTLRRGQATANEVWGNEASVLVGDFLYSRSFEMMVDVDNMRVMGILARTTNTIAEGEVMQLMNCHTPDITEARYLETIRCKTAKLFESAAQLGAVISAQPPAVEAAMADYGIHLGTAFQLVDDVLDYTADASELGKNIGDDLAEGKPTLPLIKAMEQGTDTQRELLRHAIETGGLERIDAVIDAIETTGALAYTSRLAADEAKLAKQALADIPNSPYKQALLDLADFSIQRTF